MPSPEKKNMTCFIRGENTFILKEFVERASKETNNNNNLLRESIKKYRDHSYLT